MFGVGLGLGVGRETEAPGAARHLGTLVWLAGDAETGLTAELDALDALLTSLDTMSSLPDKVQLNLRIGAFATQSLRCLYRSGGAWTLRTESDVNFTSGDYASKGASRGLVGDGATKHRSLAWNPHAELGASAGGFLLIYNHTDGIAAGTEIEIGAINGTSLRYYLSIHQASGNRIADFFDGTTGRLSFTATGTDTGAHGMLRTSSTNATWRRGSTTLATDTDTSSTDKPNFPLFSHALNNAGVAAFHSARRLGVAAMGPALTSADYNILATAIATFEAALVAA